MNKHDRYVPALGFVGLASIYDLLIRTIAYYSGMRPG